MTAMSTGRPSPRSHTFPTVVCAFALTIGATGASLAQNSSPRPDWAMPTTVLTMAPNGSWGAATHDLIGVAIAGAIADCQQRSRGAKGCGAFQSTMRAGWSMGIRCGDKNILVAEKTLVEAEQAAIDQEIALRSLYGSELPPCVRLVSVDPSGAVVAPYAKALVGMLRREQHDVSP